MQTICLNMIVKNEGHCIARCLKSVKHLINHYVIVDTGSTDNTKEVIRETLAGIDGEIIDRPWIDFGTNRTQAIQLASGKADYLLVVDADDEIVGERPEPMTHDVYSIMVHDEGMAYERAHLFRNDIRFKYVGVLHEYLDFDGEGLKGSFWPKLRYIRHHDGARWNDDVRTKFKKDVKILVKGLSEETNPALYARYMFYLGESHFYSKEYGNAIQAYRMYLDLNSKHEEERWYARLQIARSYKEMLQVSDAIISAYFEAFESRPNRLEALYELGVYLQEQERFQLAYHLLKPAVEAPFTKDRSYVNPDVYTWRLKDLFSIVAYKVGDIEAAHKVCEDLLIGGYLPAEERDRVQANYFGSAKQNEQTFTPYKLEKNKLNNDQFFGDFFFRLREAVAPGGSELGLGLFLFNLAVSTRAKIIIEIGRFKGFSTFAMASAMKFLVEHSWEEPKQAKQRPDVNYEKHESFDGIHKVFSIDPYPTQEATDLIENNDLKKYVTFYDKPSSAFSRQDFKTPDIIFIDGDHSLEGVIDDIKRFVPILKPGGYFILHDYFGWYDDKGTNGSPIKQACDKIVSQVPQIERILVDTGYASFMVFRKPLEEQ